MTCSRCGASGATRTRFSWEIPPPGRFGDPDEEECLAQAPEHDVCQSCVNAAAAKHIEENPITAETPAVCPRCGTEVRYGEMIFIEKDRGAALLCPACAASGLLPWEGRGVA